MQNAPIEHSAILSTCIKLPFVFKTFVLSIFEWRLKTGFTVCSRERGLMLGLSFFISPYFVYGGSKGSGKITLCTGLSVCLLLPNVVSTKVTCSVASEIFVRILFS